MIAVSAVVLVAASARKAHASDTRRRSSSELSVSATVVKTCTLATATGIATRELLDRMPSGGFDDLVALRCAEDVSFIVHIGPAAGAPVSTSPTGDVSERRVMTAPAGDAGIMATILF